MVTRFGLPNLEYTDHTIRCLLPELGSVIGYAATVEVTTNDPDSPAASWRDHYRHLRKPKGPTWWSCVMSTVTRGAARRSAT